jgi:predicted nucleic acid-binding protein
MVGLPAAGCGTARRCNVFLSEDMQHGVRIGELTIMSPFKLAPDHQLF